MKPKINLFILWWSLFQFSEEAYRESNCYQCLLKSTNSYCSIDSVNGACCEQNNPTSDCNRTLTSNLACTNQAISPFAYPAYCLNSNLMAKCGSELILRPSISQQALSISYGALKWSQGDSCVYTLHGNQSDLTSGTFLSITAIQYLNISILYGPTLQRAEPRAFGIQSNLQMNFSIVNNTYIVVQPMRNLDYGYLKLGYWRVPNAYNISYLEAQGYFQQMYAIAASDNESAQAVLIGCLAGGLILLALIIFLTVTLTLKQCEERKIRKKYHEPVETLETSRHIPTKIPQKDTQQMPISPQDLLIHHSISLDRSLLPFDSASPIIPSSQQYIVNFQHIMHQQTQQPVQYSKFQPELQHKPQHSVTPNEDEWNVNVDLAQSTIMGRRMKKKKKYKKQIKRKNQTDIIVMHGVKIQSKGEQQQKQNNSENYDQANHQQHKEVW